MRHVVDRSAWLLGLVWALALAHSPAQAQELKKEGDAFQQRLFGRELASKPIHVTWCASASRRVPPSKRARPALGKSRPLANPVSGGWRLG